MSIMEEKFVKDFLEAQEVDKMISKQSVDFVDGLFILKDMMVYVREDIKILDPNTMKKLQETNKKLDDINTERKDAIKLKYKDAEDEEEKDFIHLKLLREDHEKYKKELFFIQKIGYNKGWFDIEKE